MPNKAIRQSEDLDQMLMLEEYKALREEIVKQEDLKINIINFYLAVTGAIFGVGLSTPSGTTPSTSTLVLLLQPVLATLLFNQWGQCSVGLHRIAYFIRTNIEVNALHYKMWETHLAGYSYIRNPVARFLSRVLSGFDLSSFGVFFAPQCLAIYLAFTRQTFTDVERVLYIVACICLVVTSLNFIGSATASRKYSAGK